MVQWAGLQIRKTVSSNLTRTSKENMEPPVRASNSELEARKQIFNLLKSAPIPDKELAVNLGLFIDPILMSRLLFLNFVYQKILSVQGIIMDLGTRWGQNAVVFETLRSIYEPYNYQRKVVAFDTFEGFVGATDKDGKMSEVNGHYSTPEGYKSTLETLLSAHEQLHPVSHIKKFDVVAGDVSATVPEYINNNKETIISLAFFDLDLYKPTLDTINNIKDRLTVGSILVFDEINYDSAPGETLAVMEGIGLRNVAVQRFPYCSKVSYIEIK